MVSLHWLVKILLGLQLVSVQFEDPGPLSPPRRSDPGAAQRQAYRALRRPTVYLYYPPPQPSKAEHPARLPGQPQACRDERLCHLALTRPMKTSRYATSRQRVCQQCSSAKTKCEKRRGPCTRCSQRGIQCIYPQTTLLSDKNVFSSGVDRPQHPTSKAASFAACYSPELPMVSQALDQASPGSSQLRESQKSSIFSESVSQTSPTADETLDFSNLNIYCPIIADDIASRWMNPYIPVPGQSVKRYPASTVQLIDRMLKSYSSIATRGRGVVPFIHPTQISSQQEGSPLDVCLNLVRICQNPMPGNNTPVAILQDAMRTIMDLRDANDEMSLLGAFQAYLVYMLVLFFRLSRAPDNQSRQAMMDLQFLATLTAKKGLACVADQHHSRPRWEEWIVTEAKRRTLYVMYLFDSILSSVENLPTFLGAELQGLPAPADKYLWQAKTRADWEQAYDVHLTEWAEKSLTIDELWPIPHGMDDTATIRRRERVNHWLEGVDEYGAMIYAVTSVTHGV